MSAPRIRSIDYEIQLATVADAPPIASMSRRLIEVGLERSWSVPRVARMIRRRDTVVIKAVSADALSGFAIMSFGDESAHLSLLAVRRRFRRLSIARHLLTWLEETALCAGTFSIGLEVRAANRGAVEFYRALGYREAGRIEGYYDGVEDALVFSKDLRVTN